MRDLSRPADVFRLDGKRALVVGGYGGLGSVVCEMLAGQGAAVAVAGRSPDRAAELAERLAKGGAETWAYELDVTSRDSVREALAALEADWAGVDVLVNCASKLVTTPAEEMPEEDWRAVVDANLTGAFWLSQEVGRLMIRAGGGGRIIHFSSVRSMAGARRGFTAYGASKAGLNLLIKQLATEWGRHGITVNGVAPVSYGRSSSRTPRRTAGSWRWCGDVSRSAGSPSRRRSRAPSCTSHPRWPASSPARSSSSTAASPPASDADDNRANPRHPRIREVESTCPRGTRCSTR